MSAPLRKILLIALVPTLFAFQNCAGQGAAPAAAAPSSSQQSDSLATSTPTTPSSPSLVSNACPRPAGQYGIHSTHYLSTQVSPGGGEYVVVQDNFPGASPVAVNATPEVVTKLASVPSGTPIDLFEYSSDASGRATVYSCVETGTAPAPLTGTTAYHWTGFCQGGAQPIDATPCQCVDGAGAIVNPLNCPALTGGPYQ